MKLKKIIFKAFAFGFGLIALGIMAMQFAPQPPTNFEPILMTRGDMEASVSLHEPKAIESPGKIWVYNDYIFLIEQYKGIHVIDNSDPATSKTIAFIQIDGCTEVAVKDGILYANNAVDMIGLKWNSGQGLVEVVSRNKNILPFVSSPEPWNDWYFIEKLPADLIIVRWVPYNQNG
jgi:hypothetical protein